jgi:hypothetical protein
VANGQPGVWMSEVGSMVPRRAVGATCGAWLAAIWLVAAPARAQDGTPSASSAAVPTTITIRCSSKPGERQHCPADTSHGVTLARSAGASPCMLGRTWGYDAQGVWVSDGCAGEFLAGRGLEDVTGKPETKEKAPAYIPNMGFLIVEGQKGEMYARLFSYVRYLNQKGLDPSYIDSFGNTRTVPQRQDVQLNKFFLALPGWFLTPKFRYYLYVWSANTSQGDPAQVVGAGYLSYTFNRYVTLGGGINALPTVRSTEGSFPYWLGVDNRLTADEFFRGSYTSGFWLKGELSTKLKYMAMIGNNLSQLGVSAAQLDNTFNTTSFMLGWLPTTGEFGLYGTFGDYDYHEKLATRLAGHYTHSREDKQTQPGTNSIENSQIRLTDGNILFTPDLFGPGITVEKVDYDMVSVDAGVKKKGFSLEGEYYWRWLSNFAGPNTAGIADIDDHGFQLQSSAMLVPRTLQAYLSGSKILGRYGNGSEVRAGLNWYVAKERGLRLNAEWIHLNNCPVGYTAVPYPVGGNGNVFHADFEMNF